MIMSILTYASNSSMSTMIPRLCVEDEVGSEDVRVVVVKTNREKKVQEKYFELRSTPLASAG